MSDNTTTMPVVDHTSSSYDKWAFIVAVFGGSGLILYLRIIGFPILLVIAVPVAAIVLYAIVTTTVKRLQLREDRVADNCYYLGFVFTLVSLAYALFTFHSDGLVTEHLINDFGIALISTITGVIVRIILSQLRADPVDIERSARLNLAQATNQLRSELLYALTDFQAYRETTYQAFAESQDKIQKKTEEVLTAAATNFEETTKGLLDDASKAIKRHQSAADRLAKSADGTVSALERLNARLEAIEAPTDLITSRMTPAIESMDQAARAIWERVEAEIERGDELTKLIKAAIDSAAVVDARLKAQQDQFAVITEMGSRSAEQLAGLSEIARQLRDTFAGIEQAGQVSSGALSAAQSEVSGLLDALKRHNAGMAEELAHSREMTSRLQAALIELAETVARRLDVQEAHQERAPTLSEDEPGYGSSGSQVNA